MYMFPKLPPKILYTSEKSNEQQFVFPVVGITLFDSFIDIGKVKFIAVSKLDYDNMPFLLPFKANISRCFQDSKTLAFVDIASVVSFWNMSCDNHSIALQLLKQSIGLIYLAYYNINNVKGEKRITISNINSHEVDEGLIPYITATKVGNSRKMTKSLLIEGDIYLECEIKRLSGLFSENYKFDFEYRYIVLKFFEFFYCLYNEIYSTERILKISAFLQFGFLKPNDDISFEPVASKLTQIFNYYDINVYKQIGLSQNDINNFGLKKPKDELIHIYNEIRNKFSHGKINPLQEFTVINEMQYFIYKVSIMEFVKLLLCNEDMRKITSVADLHNKVDSINKSYSRK